MVLAERSAAEDIRNGRRSRASSPNGHLSDDSSATDDSEHGMRIGDEYQAVVPDLISSEACPSGLPEKALLVWSPNHNISESKLDEYITVAKEKHGYNAEQALGMLFWHKFDLEAATADLPNFVPFPDEWTVEDKVLFEQAFQFYGKSFHRIKHMLPDKSMASLVKYYYSWKKTRCRTSLMDRQARKLSTHSDSGSEAGSENDSDFESTNKDAQKGHNMTKQSCSTCKKPSSHLTLTATGNLCSSCYHYWRRTGLNRTGGTFKKHESTSARHNPAKNRRKPPRGMFLNYDDLVDVATGPQGHGDNILRKKDAEIVSLKRQIQNNKQIISQLRQKLSSGVDAFRGSEGKNRISARWANEELLLAIQGIRKYGRDFKAVAEVIGTKTEAHVRSFFITYRRRYNLDSVLQEYEAEHGIANEDTKDELQIEIDSGASSHSGSPSITVAGSTSPTSFRSGDPSIQTSCPQ
ncbi:REST corepressor 1-like isoform X1 [Centruroides vittatus]|uniref:REST corepressor 1-like isoform X1 n=1 Tax=Centruroides sculpturatus TaxID=218467 RepID=UPI000C6DD8EC|nr:REST corepressor 1-like isoform X1 [Centruroides sculpturatus]